MSDSWRPLLLVPPEREAERVRLRAAWESAGNHLVNLKRLCKLAEFYGPHACRVLGVDERISFHVQGNLRRLREQAMEAWRASAVAYRPYAFEWAAQALERSLDPALNEDERNQVLIAARLRLVDANRVEAHAHGNDFYLDYVEEEARDKRSSEYWYPTNDLGVNPDDPYQQVVQPGPADGTARR